ncbi:hypothetical protein [Streptacidiphilus jiangxiensis]|uniref:Penicillinase repressor n=1 Tax=Streptacidiphilus jiangxiensis TaxID=235985 RepID=A0A1H7WG39_STRJI|nr:hypothetical protein [Streptacidiphilus jiangxiensis]SEM20440.1 hypothetical protein SAMN05414137_120140 [Streptacidiphilus jiangxiensis]
MTNQPAATLRSRYAVQAAADLEENRRRQRELAEELRMLRQEETLLVDIIALAEQHQVDTVPSPLPEQGTSSARAARTTTKPAAVAKGKQPLLGDLLLELLSGHSKPRAAKDLRDDLLRTHPDREPTPQVVRNTLESLVAKGHVRRHKDDRLVTYTLVKRPGNQSGRSHV